MYSLTALLGWIAMVCFLRAFALPAAASGAGAAGAGWSASPSRSRR